MTLGIRTFRDPRKRDRLPGMRVMPFAGKPRGEPGVRHKLKKAGRAA